MKRSPLQPSTKRMKQSGFARADVARLRMRRAAMVTTKPRKDSRRELKAALDVETSRVVRERDKRCVLCGSTQSLECGHYFKRAAVHTRWNLENCHALCHDCNQRDNSDHLHYTAFMKATYDAGILDRLTKLHLSVHKPTDAELKDLLTQFIAARATQEREAA